MTKAPTEMVVVTKLYDLVLWTTNHTLKFPKSHKFSLGDRLELRLHELLELLITAKYTKERQALLERANLSLELLRFQYRLAKDLRCLSLDSYAYAARSVNEIGQLVGGWMKARTR